MDTMKAEQIGSTRWRVLAIPFGGPFKGKDFDGEFFDAETDIKPRWFKERPVVFHHGGDDVIKDADLGIQELDDEPTAEGWWGTTWLERSNRYWAQVDAMLRAGKMFGSSGSIGHFVRKDHQTGHIEVWPHVEQTLTLTPANPYARITASKAIAHFNTAGLALPDDLLTDLSAAGEPSGDLANDGDAVAMKSRALIEAERFLARASVIHTIR
jgi:hypothetical protein